MSEQNKITIENAYKSILNNEQKAKRDRKIRRPKKPKLSIVGQPSSGR